MKTILFQNCQKVESKFSLKYALRIQLVPLLDGGKKKKKGAGGKKTGGKAAAEKKDAKKSSDGGKADKKNAKNGSSGDAVGVGDGGEVIEPKDSADFQRATPNGKESSIP